MDENSLKHVLQQNFPKTNKQNWKVAASAELNGSEPFKKLAWSDSDDIEFFPYYDRDDTSTLKYLENFSLAASKNSFSGARGWINAHGITVTEELSANRKALDHLSNGADGILFQISNEKTNFSSLLKSIEAEYCHLSFHGNQSIQVTDALIGEFSKFSSSDKINGCFFWDNVPQLRKAMVTRFKNFRFLSPWIQSATPATEISRALIAGERIISSYRDDIPPNELVSHIAFSFPLHASFLHNIAKLKAFRLLWFQVVSAYGVPDRAPSDVHIHARAEKYFNAEYEPNANMLQGTLAAMSAIIGGADALTIAPENETNGMMDRIARNVSNILREESHFDKVSDPLAGAYAVDAMVNELSQKAWTLFQSSFQK